MSTKQNDNSGGFATRTGLILTLIGLSVGTGNIWRFPRMAALNGGGAFILAWTIMWALVSIPVMMAEHSLGRATRHGIPGAFKDFAGKNYTWMGIFMTLVVVGITGYYSAVIAWVFHYLILAVTKGYYGVDTIALFDTVANGNILTVILFTIVLGLTALIVLKGISGGIEKAQKFMMPSLFIILVIVAVRGLTLAGSEQGLNYLFSIDTSYLLMSKTWLNALTQTAWSCGPGWGLVLTYAIYTKPNSDISLNTVTQAFGNNFAALVAALAIIPAVFAMVTLPEAEAIMASGNNGLAFISLTSMFTEMPAGYIVGILFFLALFVAGLSSNLGHFLLASVPFVDSGISKKKAVGLMFVVAFIWGLPSAWSAKFLDNQDWVLGQLLLFGSIFTCFIVARFGVTTFRKKFINIKESELYVGGWFDICIKFLAPAIIVIMILWWSIQSISWYPETWWNPLETFSLGTWIVQGGAMLVLAFVLNNKVSNSVKNKYFNGETFPPIPEEHKE